MQDSQQRKLVSASGLFFRKATFGEGCYFCLKSTLATCFATFMLLFYFLGLLLFF